MAEGAQLHAEYLERPSYSFLQTIGQGTQGKSALYAHEVLGRRVVSKTISLLGVPGGLAASEPRLLENIDHPRIVRVREAQWAPGFQPDLKVVTFTTDFCEGLSVAASLDEGHQFSTSEALRVTADVLSALDHLHHEHRLLHRDVKPGNVMLDADRSRGYLGDFGSAAVLDTNGTAPSGGCTPLYQAPESNGGRLTPVADVYGAGMVLVEMLQGPPDFAAMDRDKIDRRLAEGRRSLADSYFTSRPWVPPAVASIVRAMTDRDPARRPPPHQALQRINRTICMSWRQVSGVGDIARWEGRWPPNVTAERQRRYELTATPIARGPYRGMLHLQASWRKPTTTWTNYARLARRIVPDDNAGLAAMFRDVESAAAQAAPAR